MCQCNIIHNGLAQKILLESEKEFKVTIPIIEKNYEVWNKRAFGNKLPEKLRFVISDRIAALGHVSGQISLRSIREFAISSKFHFTKEQFIDVLLHEMIHVWQITNGKKGGHLADFKSMAQQLNSKYGTNITTINNITPTKEKVQLSKVLQSVPVLIQDYKDAMGKRVCGFNLYSDMMYARRAFATFKDVIERKGIEGKVWVVQNPNIDLASQKWHGYKLGDRGTQKTSYYPIKYISQLDELNKGTVSLEYKKEEDQKVIQAQQEKNDKTYWVQVFRIEPMWGRGKTTYGCLAYENESDAIKSAEIWEKHSAISEVKEIKGSRLFMYITPQAIRSFVSSSNYTRLDKQKYYALAGGYYR